MNDSPYAGSVYLEPFPPVEKRYFIDGCLNGEYASSSAIKKIPAEDCNWQMSSNQLAFCKSEKRSTRVLLVEGTGFDVSLTYSEFTTSSENLLYLGTFFLNGAITQGEEFVYRRINRLKWLYVDRHLCTVNVAPIVRSLNNGVSLQVRSYVTPSKEKAVVIQHTIDESIDVMGNIRFQNYNHYYVLGTERPFLYHLFEDYLDNEC